MSCHGRWRREVAALCADECARARAGFQLDDDRPGHPRVILSVGEATRFVVFQGTPSDNARGLLNLRGVIRRELQFLAAAREAGVAKAQGAGISSPAGRRRDQRTSKHVT